MKYKFYVLCAVLMLCLQGLSAQNSYMKQIPLQLPDPNFYAAQYTPKQIYPCPDGGVMILGDCKVLWDAGSENPPGQSSDCGAIKLDSNGNSVWQWWSRNFNGWGSMQILGIDQEPNGRVNFIINNPSFSPKLGWIEPDGDYDLPLLDINPYLLNRAMRLPNGDIFVIGMDVSLNPARMLFLHLSHAGEVLSTRCYYPDTLWINPNSIMIEAYDMELDTDGFPISTCIFTDRFASVVKTDWDGNIIWRYNTSAQTYGLAIPIAKIPSSNTYVFGYQSNIGGVNNMFNLFQVDNAGIDSLFSIQMSDGHCFGGYYSIIGNNQGISLSGFFGTQIHISSYNLQGINNWLWEEDAIYNLYQPTDCLVILPDNCVLYAYGNDMFGNYGLNLVKLLPDGTDAEDEYLPPPSNELMAYPNPMRSELTIDIKTDKDNRFDKSSVYVYNLKGQIVKQINPERKSTSQMTANWDGLDSRGGVCAAGMYLLSIDNGQTKYTKKIMIIK